MRGDRSMSSVGVGPRGRNAGRLRLHSSRSVRRLMPRARADRLVVWQHCDRQRPREHVPEGQRVAYGSLQLGLKRTMDIGMAVALLVLLAPVMPLAVVAIKLDSPGPVLYNRVRVGKDGRQFVMYKLRTMTADAEQRLTDLQQLNHGAPHMIKIADDPRVTRTGKL